MFENGGGLDDFETKEVSIVRKKDRSQFFYPNPALTKDFLLTNLEGKLQVIYSTTEPGGNRGQPYTHNSDEECVIILAGEMELKVNDEIFMLYQGDTIKYSSRLPHSWKNIGEETLEVLWIITPPSF